MRYIIGVLCAGLCVAVLFVNQARACGDECTPRPPNASEHAYFAHYATLKNAVPKPAAGWTVTEAGAKQTAPPETLCKEDDPHQAYQSLEVYAEYNRPLSGVALGKARVVVAADSQAEQQAKLKQLKTKQKQWMAQSKVLQTQEEPLKQQAEPLKAQLDAIQAKEDNAQGSDADELDARYDKVYKSESKIEDKITDLDNRSYDLQGKARNLGDRIYLLNQIIGASTWPDTQATVDLAVNVGGAGLCLNPQKLSIPGAVAWRCHHGYRYSAGGDLNPSSNKVIVIFTKHPHAVSERRLQDQYYDKFAAYRTNPNDYLDIQIKTDPSRLLTIQNVRLIVASDNAARTDQLFKAVNLNALRALLQ